MKVITETDVGSGTVTKWPTSLSLTVAGHITLTLGEDLSTDNARKTMC